MENVTVVEISSPSGDLIEYAVIDRGNGEFTSMPKSEYDRLEAAKEVPAKK